MAWYCIIFGLIARYHTVMYRCNSAPANYRVVHLVIFLYWIKHWIESIWVTETYVNVGRDGFRLMTYSGWLGRKGTNYGVAWGGAAYCVWLCFRWQRQHKDKHIGIYSVYNDKDDGKTNILTFTAITMTKTTQRQIYWHLQRLQWRRRRKDKYIDIYSVCNDKDDAKTNILKFTIIFKTCDLSDIKF